MEIHEAMDGSMRLKFDGQTHSIDANALISLIVHYQTIANAANRAYSKGVRDIHIKVNAIEQGSFIIDLSVTQNVIEKLFTNDAVEYVYKLVGIIGGVYALYKAFRGKPVKTEEEKEQAAQITTEVNIAVNVYNQQEVREAISKSIERAEEDVSVEGFAIMDKKTTTYFHREEFKDYIYDDFDKEEDIPNERVLEEEAVLTILTLRFDSESRWQFLYNGFKISATIRDETLMKIIDRGERFGKGDAIRVRLKILQTYINDCKAYANKSYKIEEFIEHIIPPQTANLFE